MAINMRWVRQAHLIIVNVVEFFVQHLKTMYNEALYSHQLTE